MGKKKAANINITIENNLLSKNKNLPEEEESVGNDREVPLYNFERPDNSDNVNKLPDEIATYYRLQNAKQLYSMTPQPAPVNLANPLQTLGTPVHTPLAPPTTSIPPPTPAPAPSIPSTPSGMGGMGGMGAAGGGGPITLSLPSSPVVPPPANEVVIVKTDHLEKILNSSGKPQVQLSDKKFAKLLEARATLEDKISRNASWGGRKVPKLALYKLGLVDMFAKKYGYKFREI